MEKEIKKELNKHSKIQVLTLLGVSFAVACSLLFSIWAIVYVAKEDSTNGWMLADCVLSMVAAIAIIWYAIFGRKHGHWAKCIPVALLGVSICASIGTDAYNAAGSPSVAAVDCSLQALLLGLVIFAATSFKKPKISNIVFCIALVLSVVLAIYWTTSIASYDDFESKKKIAWCLWCWTSPTLICGIQVGFITDDLRRK